MLCLARILTFQLLFEFTKCSEQILREIKDMKGLVIGGYNMNNLRYADDTVLISDSSEELQALLDKVVIESEKRGLSISCKKTECMVISKKSDIPDCQLLLGGNWCKTGGEI